VPLIFGRLQASDYDDAVAGDARIDALRKRMQVVENTQFTHDYYDAAKRYIGNAIQVFFRDGSSTRRVAVDYPIGHRLRRAEGLPLLKAKFEAGVRGHFEPAQAEQIVKRFFDRSALEAMPVSEMMSAMVRSGGP
jgi:2-methylcitrate dehydratase